jgi:adenylate cyclase
MAMVILHAERSELRNLKLKYVPSLLLGAFFCGLAIFLRIYDPPIVSSLRNSGFDTLQRMWPREKNGPQNVTIVDIDEASLKTRGQWPWPRGDMAKLVDELDRLGAAAIVFDIVFPEPDRNSTADDQLFAAAIRGRPVVNAFATSQGPFTVGPTLKAGFAQTGLPAAGAAFRLAQLTQNLEVFDDAARGLGSMNIDLANDQGVARQVPLLYSDGHNLYPSLILEALRVAQNADAYVVNSSANQENALESIRIGDFEIPTDEHGQLFVNYRFNDPAIFVSAADVIAGKEADLFREKIQGHIVLIGTSAVGLLDTRTSALGETIPGVAVHAQALEQILSNAFLSRPESVLGAELWFMGLFGLSIALLTAFMQPSLSSAALIFFTSVLAAGTIYSFRELGLLFDFTFPFLALLGNYIVGTAYRLLVTDREGRKLRHAFGHYVAPAILAEIEQNPSALKLGGEQREVTVMFVDIEDFTPMTENLPPEKLVQMVNTILQICSAEILAEGGTIDKYIGDAVMAFWNAPTTIFDHQYHAAKAALNIQRRLQNHMHDGQNIKVRIGLATGNAIVGNMGSEKRFDYSVLGAAVNTAARAEQTCKRVAHNIILAGELIDKTNQLAVLQAGSAPMKGKAKLTKIHAIFGDEAFAQSKDFMSLKLALSHTKTTKPQCEQLAADHPSQRSFLLAIPLRQEDYKSKP